MRIAVRLRPQLVVICACIAAAVSVPAFGQEASAIDPANLITAREIEANIESVQASTTLAEEQKNQIVGLYNDALAFVRARDEWSAKTAGFQQDRASAPADLEKSQNDLAAKPPEVNLAQEIAPGATDEAAEQALNDTSLADLEIRFADADRALGQLRAKVTELEARPAERTERRRLIAERQPMARQRLAEVQAKLDSQSPAGDVPELVNAQRTVQLAEVQSLNQELLSYDEELQSYEARRRLLAVRTDLRRRERDYAEDRADAWRKLVTQRRNDEAKRAAAEAMQALFEASDAPPEIRREVEALAEENVALADVRTGEDGILRRIEQADQETKKVEARLAPLKEDFAAMRTRVEAVGNTESVGVLLRNHRASLPDAAELRRKIRRRSETIGQNQLEKLKYDEKRRPLANLDAVIESTLNRTAPNVTGDDRDRLAGFLRTQYETQRESLDVLINDLETYDAALFALDT